MDGPGVTVNAWTYDGGVPGPLIRVRVGDRLVVRFTNHLPQPTTVHWHGLRIPIQMDGVPGHSQPEVQPGGSFTYTSSDGIATSNAATANVVNNAASTTALTGTGSDDILIATNGAETLSGGGGNDVLIGNAGSHVMSGGGGNYTFAFVHDTDGPATITDFNNTAEHDHIAVSASGFGGGLTAGMDVTQFFETSNDNQFSGEGPLFHFDTANNTLYFSATGTSDSEIVLAQVQAGGTIHAHDILIV